MKSRGLGRGLSALIGENILAEAINSNGNNKEISLDKITPNPDQPRMVFKEEELNQLARSIEQKGILQPLLLKETDIDKYLIIAGERRWRAAKIAGLKSVPAIVTNLSEQEIFEVALIENIQREDLNPIEEADGYRKLIKEYNYTQERVAEIVSKSRSHIANLLRLLNLPEKVQESIKQGDISVGHGKLLLSSKNPEKLLEQIIEENLSVRDIEMLLEKEEKPKKQKNPNKNIATSTIKDHDISSLEQFLETSLGMEIKIIQKDQGQKVIIYCDHAEQLDIIISKLTSSLH